MSLRFALAAACLGVAACGPVVYTIGPERANYRPGMLRAFDDGVLPLFLVGGDDAVAQRFADAMSGRRNGADLTFVPGGDTGASFGYRVVVRVEGVRGRVQEMCEIGAPPNAAAADAAPFANFAFCRGDTPITMVATTLDAIEGPAFDAIVRAAMVDLFPAAPDDQSDGGRLINL